MHLKFNFIILVYTNICITGSIKWAYPEIPTNYHPFATRTLLKVFINIAGTSEVILNAYLNKFSKYLKIFIFQIPYIYLLFYCYFSLHVLNGEQFSNNKDLC